MTFDWRPAAVGGMAAIIGVFGAAIGPSAADEFHPLPARQASFTVQGRTVSVRYVPAFRGVFKAGQFNLDFHLDGDLSDLQKSIGGILDGDKANDECGTRVNVSSTALIPTGNVARLLGTVRYEQWKCVKTKVPVFHGLKLSMELQTAKTQLFQQTFDLCIDLTPGIGGDGTIVALEAVVTCAKPSADSILGKIGELVSLENVFIGLGQDLVEKMRDKLAAPVPPELAAYKVRLETVRFFDRGQGSLGLEATGSAIVTPAQFKEILANLLH